MSLINSLLAKTLRVFLNRAGMKIPYPLPEYAADCTEQVVQSTQGAVRVLIHRPRTSTGPLPVYLNLHGGGFIFGLPEHDAPFCNRIAEQTPCIVVNVDYAKAPEQAFPAGLEQSYAVLEWVVNNASSLNADITRIAVGGNSAGGNLATGVARLARDRKGPGISLQVLNYPPVDITPGTEKPERENQSKVLNPRVAKLFNNCYVPDPAQRYDVRVSPGHAPASEHAGLPPALVITAELDLLRDSAERYAESLRAAGVPVVQKRFAGCDHAFTHMGPQQSADAAWALVISELRKAFRQT